MKAISLWQPWASAIALDIKRIETRGWETHCRGELAICAAQKKTAKQVEIFNDLITEHDHIRLAFQQAKQITFADLPFGSVVAFVKLENCDRIHFGWSRFLTETEMALGDYSSGHWAWILRNVRRLKTPVPVIGHQSLFNLPPDVEAKVRRQL